MPGGAAGAAASAFNPPSPFPKKPADAGAGASSTPPRASTSDGLASSLALPKPGAAPQPGSVPPFKPLLFDGTPASRAMRSAKPRSAASSTSSDRPKVRGCGCCRGGPPQAFSGGGPISTYGLGGGGGGGGV